MLNSEDKVFPTTATGERRQITFAELDVVSKQFSIFTLSTMLCQYLLREHLTFDGFFLGWVIPIVMSIKFMSVELCSVLCSL